MQNTLAKVETEIQVDAKINGISFSVMGRGEGVPGSGDVSVSVSTQDTMPEGFHLSLFAFVLITGQADISRPVGTENLFLKTGGIYHATRTLNLGSMGELLANYSVEPIVRGCRKSTFSISGKVNVPPLVSVEPTFEAWVPAGPGRIDGHFSMVWKAYDDTFVKGETETRYFLPTAESLKEVQCRHIRFEVSCSGNTLTQSEKIVLFSTGALSSVSRSLAATSY